MATEMTRRDWAELLEPLGNLAELTPPPEVVTRTDNVTSRDWEHIDMCTFRMRVPGGWLVQISSADGDQVALCHVPDAYHRWVLEEAR